MKKIGELKYVLIALLVVGVIGSFAFFSFGESLGKIAQQAEEESEETPEEAATSDLHKISSGYVELDARSRYSGGQDAEGDWDIDVFEIDTDGDRSILDLIDDKICDCTGAKIWTIAHGDVSVYIDDDSTRYSSGDVCKPNLYKLMQKATAGNTESEFTSSDGIISVATDVNDTGGGGTNEFKLTAGKTYLITVEDADENDFYFTAFLFRMPEFSVIEAEDIADSTKTNFIIDVDLWADAVTKSEIDVEGECSDDQDHDDYNADDGGVIADQLTTNTSDVNIDCNFDIELQSDGVALILENPFDAGSQTYMGYIKVDPYGQNDTGANTTDHDLIADGDDYTGTSCTANGGDTIYTLIVQGKEIVSDSTTDCYTDYAGEKLRANEVSTGLFGNIYDKGSSVRMTVEVNDVYEVDRDATDDGSNCLLSDGEYIADIEIYQPSSTTDLYNNSVSSDPELIG